MNVDIITFIKDLRYKPNISALVPTDASMGIPLIENETVYIPFFEVLSKEKCKLESEIFAEYPSGTVLFYRKSRGLESISYDEEKLLEIKRDFLNSTNSMNSKELIKKMKYVSEKMALMYEKALEESEK